MASPELELTGAVVSRLKADASLSELVAGRIYDDPPTSAAFPYITIGAADAIQDDAECLTSSEITFSIDAWARGSASASARSQALRVVDAVRRALQSEMTLTENALVSLEHRITRTLRDPDGLTMHSIAEFVAFVEQS